MPTYNVTLVRSYVVQIKARSETQARRCVEFFLGDPKDASNAIERKHGGFTIGEIEMMENDAIEVEEKTGL